MKRIILELSLKPFHDMTDAGIRAVCHEVTQQWRPLVSGAERVSFLLWTADGSEILDYRGISDDEIEWAKWVGNANKPTIEPGIPSAHLHSHRWLYREEPPRLTYERLQSIVRALKAASCETFGIPASVGATFDPGPEFAFSSFKYERHKEISLGDTMGESQWVHCGAQLHADNTGYAAFPTGIPVGTTLGTFLGAQSQRFLTDIGFDYIWFSNGFGYSLSSWNVTGEVFDGLRYDTAQAACVRSKILRFWQDFRRECPDFPIETRGSNLSTGMDLSSDASPVRDIYQGGFNLVSPPNSPWAAINGDYGLELVGWLSHIAELPQGSGIPFRYYIHDPWWLNSPWLDRYGREPHDIYLPLACGRINEQGEVNRPDSIALLTVDDSYGRMPDVVPLEVTPHLRRALEDFPDAPGLVTWIYPFDEYHDWTFGTEKRVNEVFFGDWFMRSAVNHGFPLNTVISTGNFLRVQDTHPGTFRESILTCPVPDADSPLAAALLTHLQNGGKVLLYGPVSRGDNRILELLNLSVAEPLGGEMQFHTRLNPDCANNEPFPDRLTFRPLLSGGGVETVPATQSHSAQVLAEVVRDGQRRLFASFDELNSGGQIGWLRGAFSAEVNEKAQLPIADDPSRFFPAERLLRWMLEKYGLFIRFDKPSLGTVDPLVLAARSRGAWFFSGFTPSTNTRLRWRFPHGVPVPVGCDVLLANGMGTMFLPTAWHRECRLFVNQSAAGEVSCKEHHSQEFGVSRRLILRGLKDAEVVFLRDTLSPAPVRFQRNDAYLGRGTCVEARETQADCFQTEPVTGDLLISW